MSDWDKPKEQLVRELHALRCPTVNRETEERRFLTLAENSQDFIVRYDRQGRHVYANPAALRMSGLTADEFLGKTNRELGFTPELCDLWESGIDQVFETGQAGTHVCRWQREGILRVLDWRVIPELDDEGRVETVLCIARDVSTLEVTQQALQASEARYHGLFDHMTNGVVLYEVRNEGQVFVIRDINLAGQQLSRVAKEVVVGKDVLEVFPAVAEIGLLDAFRRVWRSGETEFVPAVWYYDSRINHWVENWVYRLSPEEIVAVYEDVTERKQAHEEMRSLKEFYQTILENVPDGIWVTDEADRLIFFNPAMEQIAGVSADEMLGLRVTADFPPETSQEVLPSYHRAKATLRPIAYEANVVTPAGRVMVQSGSLIPRVVNGAYGGMICTIEDVTERKQARQALKEYSVRLEEMVDERARDLHTAQEQLARHERLALLGELAGGVGHELRNPLGVITNAIYYLQLVIREEDASTHEYLDIIASETRKAEKIVRDLLDFGRIQRAERQPADLVDLVAEALDRSRPPEGIQVVVEVPDDLPLARVDPQQIQQVLVNLISNAYQAMDPEVNEGERRVMIRASQDGEELSLAVTDTGRGIAPEHLAQLFEPLFTTKSHGIGFGLAISRRLIEANDGRITVDSQIGQGSTFTLWLPIQEEG